ncbi:uncharacterized protein Z520_00728 [Fonsecaea multimorphosa CBS 102226]|uniref:ADF-H domain-containing protein n=1 Tax=Fonsecaea multimorphosa CBS 102226 TaxID=1442371 RepID=A0A0D2HQ81_9EURO|nr:uncharacterized protein Z520_00728 [Fonsecaea multimorphosa CBS 102226]KIY04036.1 hypothetical protein Z520_00728 [Fonsecaea multimorphosa CBS 102226]
MTRAPWTTVDHHQPAIKHLITILQHDTTDNPGLIPSDSESPQGASLNRLAVCEESSSAALSRALRKSKPEWLHEAEPSDLESPDIAVVGVPPSDKPDRITRSESRLYTFSQETKDQLRKFRLGTSRAKTPLAKIYQIDAKTQEIKASSDDTYSDMLELADELPDSSPRFILLSYPLTLPSGRQSVPYVLLYYLPVNCNPNMRMSYAGAVELMRSTAEVNRVLEIADAEDLQEIEGRLKGED